MWNESHVNELVWWFDTAELARTILEKLEEAGIEPTVENAKKVWLDFLLTELSEGVDTHGQSPWHLRLKLRLN